MAAYQPPQQGVPVAYQAAPAPQQTVVIRQSGVDPCYMCCCPPCAIMSVEGCSPMSLVCWAACLLGFWPWNGFCALCYEPQQPTTTVIQQAPQPGYVPAQPAQAPPGAYPPAGGPPVAYPPTAPVYGAPAGAPAPAYGAPPPANAPPPGGAYPPQEACAPAPAPVV